jgi:hypothetical protein
MNEIEKDKGEMVIYQNNANGVEINVRLEDENVWLTQQQMAELFQTSRTNVVEHIQHIYEEGELSENATCRNFRQVQMEGNRNVTRELNKAGNISNEAALEKAKTEYKKYQAKTLSEVEKAYLETIKHAQKIADKKGGNNE